MIFELREGEHVVQKVVVDNDCHITLTNARIVKSLADERVVNSLELAELRRTRVGAPAIRKRGVFLSLLGFGAGLWLYLLLPQNWLGYTLSIVPVVAGVIVLLDALWLNRRKIWLRFYGSKRKPLAGLAALKNSAQVRRFMEDLEILTKSVGSDSSGGSANYSTSNTTTYDYIGKDIHT